MIFAAPSTLQKVKITVSDDQNIDGTEFFIALDPSVHMKEETIEFGKEKFKVFMASADKIENLMNLVVIHDGTVKKPIGE